MNELIRLELEARLGASIASYERLAGPEPRSETEPSIDAVLECCYAGLFCLMLGQTEEGLAWFSRVSGGERGPLLYALMAQDVGLIRKSAERLSSLGPEEGKHSSILADVLRGNDGRVHERVAALRSAGLVPWFCDMGEAIVTGSSEAFAAGLNAWLTFHKRQTQRGRHSFNSPLGFLSIDACAFCTVAASRGIEVRVDKKFSPAKVQILFIMLEDLENPPSHIQVEFVPELYRVRPPWAGQI